ncbi:MAG TPA: nuclear transport factor 2 family protein [Gemmatimonadales bacterium]
MNFISRPGVCWALVASALACRPSIDAAAERAALMEADRAFAAATARERVEGWVRFFAPDGAMFRPGGLATGHTAVRERMTPAFADTSFTLSWEPTEAHVAASGDLGYTIGRYESRRRAATGGVTTATGSYLTVWKKQPDGTWKVAADIGNPDG